jgi:hypothetical protein
VATKKKAAVDETELGDNAVKTAPGVPEGSLDREPVDRAKANEEAVGGPEPIEVTEADNPSPGRNAVPVTAEPNDPADENIPGTDIKQPRAPKLGEATR